MNEVDRALDAEVRAIRARLNAADQRYQQEFQVAERRRTSQPLVEYSGTATDNSTRSRLRPIEDDQTYVPFGQTSGDDPSHPPYRFSYNPDLPEYQAPIGGTCIVEYSGPTTGFPNGLWTGSYNNQPPDPPQQGFPETIYCSVYNNGDGWIANAKAPDGEIEGPQAQNPTNPDNLPPGTYGHGDIYVSDAS